MADTESLADLLRRDVAPVEVLEWMREHHFPRIQGHLNAVDTRKRMALYPGDTIPSNERNLTDVRNRIALIYEYELARVANAMCDEDHREELYWAYVVANRYPDLEARWQDGTRALRIEMKCLQSVAEEKAANFDALVKDLDPRTDFVAVILWEWKHDDRAFGWSAAPWVEDIFLFHARSLATLRDHYWLNRPPTSLGKGYQGFDLRYAVTCRDSVYSEEEGNYGKLMRMWSNDVTPRLALSELLERTEAEYFRMTRAVVDVGFDRVAAMMLSRLTDIPPRPIAIRRIKVGFVAGDVAVVAKWRGPLDLAELTRTIEAVGATFRIDLTEKYLSSGYRLRARSWTRIFSAKKPKAVTPALLHRAAG